MVLHVLKTLDLRLFSLAFDMFLLSKERVVPIFKMIVMRLSFSGAKLKVHSLVYVLNIVLQCSQRGIV